MSRRRRNRRPAGRFVGVSPRGLYAYLNYRIVFGPPEEPEVDGESCYWGQPAMVMFAGLGGGLSSDCSVCTAVLSLPPVQSDCLAVSSLTV